MLEIRDESADDHAAVRQLVESAFGGSEEAAIVEALRDAELCITSLVAVDDGELVGQAMFSRVWIDDPVGRIAIASLAPMAVRPDRQRRGIGSALIARGIEACRAAGWPAVIVVGHTKYYPRFGFSASAVAHIESPCAGAHFMGLDLHPGALGRMHGRVRYPACFA